MNAFYDIVLNSNIPFSQRQGSILVFVNPDKLQKKKVIR